ncbi:MAG: hypothetical protein PCFJNLEI_01853 [Verrucomicrobiae bacterium]|nr:hypothetical protein [Verrucomicrobiae bacterium]
MRRLKPAATSHTMLKELLDRLPPYRRIELRSEPDYYGASYHIAEKLGRPYPPRSFASWQHGWIAQKQIPFPERLALYGTKDDYHLVHNESHVQYLRQHGYRHVHAVGMPFLYSTAPAVERIPNSLLVMPPHTTKHATFSANEAAYLETIMPLRSQFRFLVACVSQPCVEKGIWIKSLDDAGIPWITGAAVDDGNSFLRLRVLFGSFERMTTCNVGSHVVYAAACGCKVSIYGETQRARVSDLVNEPFYRKHPELIQERDKKSGSLRSQFPQLDVPPAEATVQTAWAAEMLGAQHQRSAAEIARLLGWSKKRQFLGRHGLSPTFSLQTTGQIRRAVLRAAPATATGYYWLRHQLGHPPANETETLWRLRRDLRQVPRYVPGSYRFAWGTVQYVDARSLESQYDEIFVKRSYDFTCPTTAPRILDCGGNTGLSALWFKQQYPQARVRVVELAPSVGSAVRNNLRVIAADVEVFMVTPGEIPHLITEPVDLLTLNVAGAEASILRTIEVANKLNMIRRLTAKIYHTSVDSVALSRLLHTLQAAGFRCTFNHAETAYALVGVPEPTPFTAVTDGKAWLDLYAWQSN